MSRLWRAFHAELAGGKGSVVTLEPDEAHHVRRVLRLRAGASLSVFDGRGTEWTGRLAACDAAGVRVELDSPLESPVESPLQVRIFQGLCRRDRMEWVIQKATELGAAGIHALACERGERAKGSAQRTDRWRRIALEACKQSGRRVLPALDPVEELPAPGDRLGLLLDPDPAAKPLGEVLRIASPPAGVDLAVGPESGFTEAERSRWRDAGWAPVCLGPRILRTETAGLVAATVILHRLADLGTDVV